MASELRVNTINSRTGFGTITVSETGQDLVGITTIENLTAENTLVGAAASFTGNVSVGGVLTYEDVTNIDAVGLITARQGIEIGARPGVAASISVDGNMIVSGISTFGGALTGTTGTFSGAVSGTTGTFSGNIAANGNIVGDNSTDISGINDVTISMLSISDTITHTGDTNTKIRFPAADTITAETSGSERLRITSDGQVLVGSTSAATSNTFLEVKNAAAHTEVTIISKNDSGAIINLGDTDSYNQGRIKYDNSDNSLTFRTAATDRLSITSGGNFLVGRNAVYGSGKAQVFNTAQYLLDLSVWAADANGPTIDFYKSRNATIGSATVVQDDDVVGKLRFLGSDGANARTAAQITAQVDGPPGTNDMPGRLVFSTTADGASNSTERLRIDSAGKVGINDSSPSAYLDIAQGGIDSNVPGINIAMTGVGGGTVGPQYGLKITGGGYNNANHIYGIYVDKSAQLTQDNTAAYHKISGTYSTLMATTSICQVNDTGATGTAYGSYISARGNSGSAKTKIGYGAWIESVGTNFQLANALRLKTASGATLTYGIIYAHDSTEVFRVSANGDVYSATNSYTSDRDLKDNITTISGTSLDKIKQLVPKTFKWKLDDRHAEIDSTLTAPTNTLTGLIAQEVQSILPDIVTGTDGKKDMGINYNGLSAHLVNAVKELSAENAAMRARLDALESA